MTAAHWFTDYDRSGFPVEKAVLGGCDLSVVYVGGEWQWLVRKAAATRSPKALMALLSEPERRHLRNLYLGRMRDYVGNHNVRTELRRLRYVKLIANSKSIGSAKDGTVLEADRK